MAKREPGEVLETTQQWCRFLASALEHPSIKEGRLCFTARSKQPSVKPYGPCFATGSQMLTLPEMVRVLSDLAAAPKG